MRPHLNSVAARTLLMAALLVVGIVGALAVKGLFATPLAS
jgi:hypothetical protein